VLVAAAFCPHPPLLVPELAVGASGELAGVREGCEAAVRRALAVSPQLVVVLGDGPVTREYADTSAGSLAGFGVDLAVPLGSGGERAAPSLPLSLTVGAWLLRGVGWAGARVAVSVPDTTTPVEAAARGGRLADRDRAVGLLVMGDGSARRSERGPGYLDERAEPFDQRVARALAGADAEGLLGLDPGLARDLLVAGRASWQVAAGAAGGSAFDGVLHAHAAPYGVGYLVASWLRR
jgi:hypothetical protein